MSLENKAAFLSSPLLKLPITIQGQKLLIRHILNQKQRIYLSNCEMIMTFPIIFPKPSFSKSAPLKKKLFGKRRAEEEQHTEKKFKKFKCKNCWVQLLTKHVQFKRTFER